MEAVKKFHKERIAFAIVEGKVMYLNNSELSHIGWLVGGGLVTAEKFVGLTRGYCRDGVLTFYSGNFQGGTLVERDALNYIDSIQRDLGLDKVDFIYCGLREGKVGDIWQPLKELMIAKSCSNVEWDLAGVLERIELVEDYLDAVWDNDILLNIRLIRDKYKPRKIKPETLEDLKVFKGRLTNTWCEDNPVYLEKINNTIDRIERVLELMDIIVGE